MDVLGYFGKSFRELRMARGKDSVGIRWEGPVLSGRQTVEGSLQGEPVPRCKESCGYERDENGRLKPEIRTSPGAIPIRYDGGDGRG
jgi:hypothetical protein